MFLLLKDYLRSLLSLFEQLYYKLFLIDRGKSSVLSSGARFDVGPKISSKNHTKYFKLNVGKSAFVEDRVVVNTYHGDVYIGNSSVLGIGSIIIGPVSIGNNVSIAQNVFISGENRKRNSLGELIEARESVDVRPVKIGQGVWIGYGVVILPGVEIGKNATIAAGAVVTKNVDEGITVAGVPAKPISERLD